MSSKRGHEELPVRPDTDRDVAERCATGLPVGIAPVINENLKKSGKKTPKKSGAQGKTEEDEVPEEAKESE